MQVVATSMESRSSSLRVPSVREVLKKSIIESARRCLVVAILAFMDVDLGGCDDVAGLEIIYCRGGQCVASLSLGNRGTRRPGQCISLRFSAGFL